MTEETKSKFERHFLDLTPVATWLGTTLVGVLGVMLYQMWDQQKTLNAIIQQSLAPKVYAAEEKNVAQDWRLQSLEYRATQLEVIVNRGERR